MNTTPVFDDDLDRWLKEAGVEELDVFVSEAARKRRLWRLGLYQEGE